MPFDGNGTFTRLMNWVQDAASLIKIRADRHDQNDDDIAAGLTNCLTKDGQTQPTNNLPMNSHRIVNLAAPTNDTDAANKAYVDAIKTFRMGLEISGSDVNGQLKFTSATGANGLTFTGADLSWLARLATPAGPGTPPVPAATLNRLVLNTKPDGSGTDVITVNDDGTLVAASSITATAQLIAQAATGNDHLWFRGPKGEDRMVMYTDAATYSHAYLRVSGGQTTPQATFTFYNNGAFQAPSNLYAGGSFLGTDGNLSGSVWDQWGAHDALSAISRQIEARALAWANDRVNALQFRRSGEQGSGGTIDFHSPSGSVITGYSRQAGVAGQVYGLYYQQLQWYNPATGGWVAFHD